MNAPAPTPASSPAAAIPPAVVRRRRLLLVLLGVVFLGPPLVAAYMYYAGIGTPQGRVNVGTLIDPARPLPMVALPTPDGGATAPEFLRGRWSLVYVGDGACDAACRQAIDDLRATRLAMDRDAARIQRVFLHEGAVADRAWLEGPQHGLVVARLDGDAGAALRDAFPAGDAPLAGRGLVYVVDPHGNLMMSYATPLEKRGVVKDLEKLLKLSRIG
jgi:cytochrome oxidase Cu insertion factor (SCO1/SenC/PrrC family)